MVKQIDGMIGRSGSEVQNSTVQMCKGSSSSMIGLWTRRSQWPGRSQKARVEGQRWLGCNNFCLQSESPLQTIFVAFRFHPGQLLLKRIQCPFMNGPVDCANVIATTRVLACLPACLISLAASRQCDSPAGRRSSTVAFAFCASVLGLQVQQQRRDSIQGDARRVYNGSTAIERWYGRIDR